MTRNTRHDIAPQDMQASISRGQSIPRESGAAVMEPRDHLHPGVAAYQRTSRQLAGEGADHGESVPRDVMISEHINNAIVCACLAVFPLLAVLLYAEGLVAHLVGWGSFGAMLTLSAREFVLAAGLHVSHWDRDGHGEGS